MRYLPSNFCTLCGIRRNHPDHDSRTCSAIRKTIGNMPERKKRQQKANYSQATLNYFSNL